MGCTSEHHQNNQEKQILHKCGLSCLDNGWELMFLIKAFGLSKELSTRVGIFLLSINGLKCKNLQFGMKKYMTFLIIFHDFIFGLGIVSTYLTYHRLKCLCRTQKIALLSQHFAMLTQFLSFSMWKTHSRALVCQMYGNYSKTTLYQA